MKKILPRKTSIENRVKRAVDEALARKGMRAGLCEVSLKCSDVVFMLKMLKAYRQERDEKWDQDFTHSG